MATTGPAASAATTAFLDDKRKLSMALNRWVDIPSPAFRSILDVGYDPHPIVEALNLQGINTWTLFVSMRESDIDDLRFNANLFNRIAYPTMRDVIAADPQLVSLTIPHKSIIRAMIAFYHHISRIRQYSVEPHKVAKTKFDTYRTSIWDPNVPAIPWHLPDKVVTTEQKELLEWQRVAKPNFSDYPVLKEGTNIAQYLEKLDAAAEMHQMEKTLDVTYKLKNRELHKRKSQWMYNQFSKNAKHPAARAFVTAHSKDMRAVCQRDRSR